MLRVLTLATLFPNQRRPNLGIFVETQTRRLAASGQATVEVVNPIGLPPWPGSLHPAYRPLLDLPFHETRHGLSVHRPQFRLIPSVGWRWNPAAIARATAPVIAHLIAGGRKPQVIDAEFFYPDGPAAMMLGRRFGIPWSIKARGSDITLWGRRPAALALIRAAADGAGGLLSVSEDLRADMAALGLPDGKIRVHYTGVDMEQFALGDRAAAKAALGVEGRLIVSVGQLIPRKRHHLAIDAMTDLPGCHFWIAGEGAERPRLEAMIATRGLGDRVRLLGARPHAELPGLYQAADLSFLCSNNEGLANVMVEALACGAPVVTTPVQGARETIRAPESGRVVAEATAQALAIAALGVLDCSYDRAAVRATAAPFAWERNTAALLDHLRGIAAG